MSRPTVLVVGGGVMGVATGAALAGRGAEVTVLERYSLAHDWASSHGLSRAIRHEYGPAAIYTEMVTRSFALWEELARETRRHLYTETGVLTLGQPNDGHTLPGYEAMRAAGLPVERLTAEECAARFPSSAPPRSARSTTTPAAGCSPPASAFAPWLFASRRAGGRCSKRCGSCAWSLLDQEGVQFHLRLANEALPGLTRVDLEMNYRCPAPVLARAVRLVEHNVERFAKVIQSWPDDGGTRAVLARTNRELLP